MSVEKETTKEEIKPLFEDLKGHTQDDASYEKAIANQNQIKKEIADSKTSV